MARLQITGITKVFPGNVKALDSFSLDIAEGEFITVVGPSGCGKSTLLRIIAGLEEEDAGSLTLDGLELTGLPPKDRNMAVMFQNYALFPHLTVAENMGFGLKLRKTPKAEIRSRVEAVASTLGIGELLLRYPSEMSGGQRQRAALGRAILRKPKVYLFDEPLSNLDAKMRAQMRVEISRLHQSLKSTMIFVTHDQVEAMTMGDRVVVLKDGVMQQVADPDTLYHYPANAFVASFIGSPGMNLFQGQIKHVSGNIVFEHELFTVPVEASLAETLAVFIGRQVLFGLRPEDIGSAKAHGLTSAPILKGTLGVVERLGNSVCLYLQADNVEWAARLEEGGRWQSEQEIALPLYTPHARYFDATTGKAI
jgi:multiple sugar transport system ATP-binding protein